MSSLPEEGLRLDRDRIMNWLIPNLSLLPDGVHLSEQEIEHVVEMMYRMVQWYNGERSPGLGGFLVGVLTDKFSEVMANADETNLKAARLYHIFCYNKMPGNFRAKAKAELSSEEEE